jgi:hypothetical protein
MFYPSGTTEVSGDDPDEVALIGAAIAKGIYRHNSSHAVASEMPLANGATDPELPFSAPSPRPLAREPQVDGPFIDLSVTQYHPAILATEQHVRRAATSTTFTSKKLRTFVGHQITGVWRECQTRSVGMLMNRLCKDGVVAQVGEGKWEKLARVK